MCIAAFEWQCEWQYERRYVIRAAARVSDRIGAVSRVDIAWATLHSAVSLYVRARVRKDRSFIIENTHFSYEIRISYVLPYYVWKLEQSTHTAEFSCHVVGHGPALEQIARDSANASCIVGALLANQVLQFARHHACCARPSTCGHQLWTGCFMFLLAVCR